MKKESSNNSLQFNQFKTIAVLPGRHEPMRAGELLGLADLKFLASVQRV